MTTNNKSKAFFSFLFSPWSEVFGFFSPWQQQTKAFFSLSYVVSVNRRSLIPAEEDDDEEEEDMKKNKEDEDKKKNFVMIGKLKRGWIASAICM